MCGLIGSVNLPIGRPDLDLIAHRGPDGEGLVDHQVGSHHVWLGHRRLAIVDPSPSGAQPMTTPDGMHVLNYNGEIYNHDTLRRRRPHDRYIGHSDTESLLHALAAEGLTTLGRLNGIFAFAWLDRVAMRLYLVRDPFGVKPLYYAETGVGLCFASELRALLRFVPREIDGDALGTLLKLRFSPSPDTLLRGVKRLRPGHVLEIGLDSERLVIHEQPYLGRIPRAAPRLDLREVTHRYGELLTAAVERQLMSDVELGVLLSGGIDSALVASIAQQRTDRPLKAFTVGFTDSDAADVDEVVDAAGSAADLGLEHHVVRIGYEDFLGSLRECVATVEEPLATTSMVPMYFLAQLAAKHVKVVLSGQGADEPLGGYGRYQAEILSRVVPTPVARITRQLVLAAGLRNEQARRGVEALSEGDDLTRFLEAYAVFSDEEIERLTGHRQVSARHRLQYFYDLLGCESLDAPVERMMALDLRLGLADDLLLYTDKVTMRSSLECRVPFLDLELVSFIESLPSEYRVRLGRGKIIHKKFAERRLPTRIVHRKKRGFWSPTRRWFRNEGLLRSTLMDQGSKLGHFLDPGAVERTIVEHQQGHNRERHLFLLLCLRFWLDEFA